MWRDYEDDEEIFQILALLFNLVDSIKMHIILIGFDRVDARLLDSRGNVSRTRSHSHK